MGKSAKKYISNVQNEDASVEDDTKNIYDNSKNNKNQNHKIKENKDV